MTTSESVTEIAVESMTIGIGTEIAEIEREIGIREKVVTGTREIGLTATDVHFPVIVIEIDPRLPHQDQDLGAHMTDILLVFNSRMELVQGILQDIRFNQRPILHNTLIQVKRFPKEVITQFQEPFHQEYLQDMPPSSNTHKQAMLIQEYHTRTHTPRLPMLVNTLATGIIDISCT
jgi:hypothetical protein